MLHFKNKKKLFEFQNTTQLMKLKKDMGESKILSTQNSIERLWEIRREEEFSDLEVVRKRLNIWRDNLKFNKFYLLSSLELN